MQLAGTYPFTIDNILAAKSTVTEYPCNYDYVPAPQYLNGAYEHPGYSGYPGYYAAPAPAPLAALQDHETVYSAAYGYPGYGGYATGYGPLTYPQITDLGTYDCGIQQHNLVPAAAPSVPRVSSSELNYLAQIMSRPKRHRVRTVFTDSQTEELELLFGRSDYPVPEARERLARRVGLSEETIRVWFKNRRARRKRQSLKPKSRKTAHKTTKESDDASSESEELTV
ncbi:Homeobox protein goosecoid isoform A [Acipenser ruthenus]|uniref:Homeobox protein goosecoid isoform A n=1 Tax=Acipenser ruthenus TaxID=7906 RepID=A0A444U6A6_ACIRT|nr:homeobox protein goosecoid-like [Acipenser ruthenus]RXM30726.1 Homeobox protein goosecoid isoform A [Acipenser ruthenus]